MTPELDLAAMVRDLQTSIDGLSDRVRDFTLTRDADLERDRLSRRRDHRFLAGLSATFIVIVALFAVVEVQGGNRDDRILTGEQDRLMTALTNCQGQNRDRQAQRALYSALIDVERGNTMNPAAAKSRIAIYSKALAGISPDRDCAVYLGQASRLGVPILPPSPMPVP